MNNSTQGTQTTTRTRDLTLLRPLRISSELDKHIA
jgi:hypothetical protein